MVRVILWLLPKPHATHAGVAVAVSAIMGTPGNLVLNVPSLRYSSRKSCPHSYQKRRSSDVRAKQSMYTLRCNAPVR